AVITRYSALSVRRHSLPWPADPARPSMPRGAVEMTLQAPMGPLRVTTTHLEYYSEVQRRAQALRLRNLHDEACQRAMHPGHPTAEGGPVDLTPQTTRSILAGDFNFPPEHPAYREIQHSLASGAPRYRDAWALAHHRHPHPPRFCVHRHDHS